MRIFSDFKLFERPPKPGVKLFRWIPWRWLFLGALFTIFVATIAIMHYFGGEPFYYTNEDRYLSEQEVRTLIGQFLSIGGLFLILGLLGVVFIPKT